MTCVTRVLEFNSSPEFKEHSNIETWKGKGEGRAGWWQGRDKARTGTRKAKMCTVQYLAYMYGAATSMLVSLSRNGGPIGHQELTRPIVFKKFRGK